MVVCCLLVCVLLWELVWCWCCWLWVSVGVCVWWVENCFGVDWCWICCWVYRCVFIVNCCCWLLCVVLWFCNGWLNWCGCWCLWVNMYVVVNEGRGVCVCWYVCWLWIWVVGCCWWWWDVIGGLWVLVYWCVWCEFWVGIFSGFVEFRGGYCMWVNVLWIFGECSVCLVCVEFLFS